MNKKQYLEKRNQLIAKAEGFLNEGKLDEAKSIRADIEKLDADFEVIAKEAANLTAMKGKTVVADITDTNEPDNLQPSGMVAPMKPQNDTDLYRTAFAKSMMGAKLDTNELAVFNKINSDFQNTTQTAATHTVLVPETVRQGIWQEIGEAHPIIGDLAMTFVKGDLAITRETSGGDDGAWYDEDTETAEGTVSFDDVNLTGCELSKDITVSWKLKKMSIDAFLAYITSKIAEKMGNALAKAVVEGKGKPGEGDTFKAQPKGIAVTLEGEAQTSQIVTYATTADVDYVKLTSALAKMKSGYLNGSAIYAKNDMIWNVLANIVDEIGRPLFVPDLSGGGVGRLFGLPVKEEDGVSDGEILIGNVAKGYAMNVNENMTMYQEDHIKQRKTDYMGYAIVDGDVITTKAFVLIKSAA